MRQWATLADEQGHPRLNNPNDFVRFEIQRALQRGVRVIPVLKGTIKGERSTIWPAVFGTPMQTLNEVLVRA